MSKYIVLQIGLLVVGFFVVLFFNWTEFIFILERKIKDIYVFICVTISQEVLIWMYVERYIFVMLLKTIYVLVKANKYLEK